MDRPAASAFGFCLDRHQRRSVLTGQSTEPVNLPPDMPPLLMVIVDSEESFDWSAPLARANTRVTSMTEQAAAHEIFAKYGVIPTYVIDYPVATTESSATTLAQYLKAGVCEIGAHLHPWVNPPDDEGVSPFNSYPGNLPAGLEREKIEVLTTAIEQNLGIRPRLYKAGRYGVGPNTAQILEETGYDIDLSVVAHTSFAADGGPDFSSFKAAPYWFGAKRKLLEVPLTCGFAGIFAAMGPRLFPSLAGSFGMGLRLPGIAARTGLLERVRLTPEGIDHHAHRRLIDSLLAEGQKVFTMAYHSPSLEPGNTPYVRDRADLKAFLETMNHTLDYFVNEVGGQATTPRALIQLLRPHSEQENI
ncbi:MAG: polysaccharide deacetylase family protein [Alphaproteobacteria bacterium]|nr:polysaccharide deacetylase family protein [Alphaproteobacteria bacterium]